ncbi:hypothetical protein ACLB2K_038120 [Fragaria x ananassa]
MRNTLRLKLGTVLEFWGVFRPFPAELVGPSGMKSVPLVVQVLCWEFALIQKFCGGAWGPLAAAYGGAWGPLAAAYGGAWRRVWQDV